MREKTIPRITFGIIVLNGEPFAKYCLRQLYPFAHEVIVVEGGSRSAIDQALEGHSIDGTLEALQQFKEQEDPENKVQIITKDSFWEEKDEQSQAYAERATGDYLWQIDIDEFYKAKDIQAICKLLYEEPSIDGIGFRLMNFWGSFDTVVDSWIVRRSERNWGGIRRLFRWGKGFRYTAHRPPTVYDGGGRNLRNGYWITGKDMAKRGIYCYHYGMIFEKQAQQKVSYYQNMFKSHQNMKDWYENVFLDVNKPFHIVHGTELPGWLKRYTGSHPEQVVLLQKELKKMGGTFKQGNKEAITKVLSSNFYRLGCFFLGVAEPLSYYYSRLMDRVWTIFGLIRGVWHLAFKMLQLVRRPTTWLALEELPDCPDLFRTYRSLASHLELIRRPGGWLYKGQFYADYLTVGGASHAIFHEAQKYCQGKGIDVGAGYWPLPGAIAVDTIRGPGEGKSVADFADASLDFVFSSHCLEHIEDWQAALKEWVAKLKPGGILFLYLPHPSCEIWRPGSPMVGDGHKWVPTPEVIKQAIQELGCEIVSYDDGPDAMFSFYVCGQKREGAES